MTLNNQSPLQRAALRVHFSVVPSLVRRVASRSNNRHPRRDRCHFPARPLTTEPDRDKRTRFSTPQLLNSSTPQLLGRTDALLSCCLNAPGRRCLPSRPRRCVRCRPDCFPALLFPPRLLCHRCCLPRSRLCVACCCSSLVASFPLPVCVLCDTERTTVTPLARENAPTALVCYCLFSLATFCPSTALPVLPRVLRAPPVLLNAACTSRQLLPHQPRCLRHHLDNRHAPPNPP